MAKTPDEIKKGLNVLYPPSSQTTYSEYVEAIACIPDALALIEQLERERDAAVADLKGLGCTYCKRLESPDESMCFDKCVDNCNWKLRGVKEEKDDNT